MNNPISSIPNERLTYEYWERSKEQARLEGEWQIVDHQRLPLLSEITGWFTGESHASAERKARITPEYQEFIAKMGKVKEDLVLARARTKALDLEIRLRLNKSFQERTEFKGGSLNT
jgi:hypothetical protein